jgi:hypothetical protein
LQAVARSDFADQYVDGRVLRHGLAPVGVWSYAVTRRG